MKLFFLRRHQPLFIEMAKKLNIEFVPCLNFNVIKKLDCLLVFDDSCEEIYQEKEFVKFAGAG